MKLTSDLKNIKWGEIPDGVVVKVWLWIKFKSINWAVYSEYTSPSSNEGNKE